MIRMYYGQTVWFPVLGVWRTVVTPVPMDALDRQLLTHRLWQAEEA
jgi:hypothetical protein